MGRKATGGTMKHTLATERKAAEIARGQLAQYDAGQVEAIRQEQKMARRKRESLEEAQETLGEWCERLEVELQAEQVRTRQLSARLHALENTRLRRLLRWVRIRILGRV